MGHALFIIVMVAKRKNKGEPQPDSSLLAFGAEWLGEVPSDWDVRRIRFLFQIKKRIAGAEGYDVLSISQQGIKIKDVESNDGQVSLDCLKYQFVKIGVTQAP
jgi:type I restriction enzyme S subunit